MRPPALLLPIALLAAAPLPADTVHLKNGRSYENVIATSGPDGVTVRFAFGAITLPHSQIASIESDAAPLADYLSGRDRLRGAGGTAAEWIALAELARAQGLTHGVREAALAAAAVDPRAEGLGALLRPLGFVFDETTSEWIDRAEAMRRRGFVEDGGEWVTVAERDRRRERARDELARQLAALRREREMARIAELEARREVDRHEGREHDGVAVTTLWVVPGYLPWWPVTSPPPSPSPEPPSTAPPAEPPPQRRGSYDHLMGRQPGSFLPAGNGSSSSRTSTRPPG